MSDEVKFIFKTLMKVPVFIIVSFLILNMFAFFFIYFKVLGLSYVVMQTAVENNYLPPTEIRTLCKYAQTFEDIPMVTNAAIVVAKNGNDYTYTQDVGDNTYIYQSSKDETGKDRAQNSEGGGGELGTKSYEYVDMESQTDGTALKKVQYGKSVTVGVHCGYKLVWPLGYKETINGVTTKNADDDGTNGVEGYNTGKNFAGFKSDEQLASDREDKATMIQFDICHTVPGLKYYPDLLAN